MSDEALENAFHELLVDRQLGTETRNFLTGPVGQYLSNCLEMEIERAQNALATVLPWRRRRIIQLQNEIWRAKTLRAWLADLIINGDQAAQALADANDPESEE